MRVGVRERRGGLRVLWLLALILATLAPRAYDLGKQGFWLDESFSVWNSAGTRVGLFMREGRPFQHEDLVRRAVTGPQVLRSIRSTENTPPLYFLILRTWIGITGSSELAVRSLSVLFGLVTVLVLLFGIAPLYNPRIAWSAAWLLALSPMHIGYSRQARNYALAALLALLTLLWLLQALRYSGADENSRRPRLRAWSWYGVCAALGLYTNYLLGLILLAQGVALAVFSTSRRRDLTAWALAASGAAALFVPWVIFAITRQAQDGLALTDSTWLHSVVRFGAKLLAYLFVGETSLKLAIFSLGVITLPLLGLLVCTFAALLKGWRVDGQARAGAFTAFSAVLFLPLIVVLCLASQTWLLVSPRFSVPILPALCLAIALGLSCSQIRIVGRFPLARCGTPLLVGLYAALLFTPASVLVDAGHPGEGWRRAASYLTAEGRVGDVIVLDGAAGAAPLNIYYQGALTQLPVTRLDRRHRVIATSTLANAHRIWLVESYHRCARLRMESLLSEFTPVRRMEFGPALALVLLHRGHTSRMDRARPALDESL